MAGDFTSAEPQLNSRDYVLKEECTRLFNRLLCEFAQPTLGHTKVEFPSGNVHYVHLFGPTNAFRVIDESTNVARCEYTIFKFIDCPSQHTGGLGTLYLKHTHMDGTYNEVPVCVVILDQLTLTKAQVREFKDQL